ncbi:MAG: hypothetical protein JWN66_3348 [Sphingomonas bacterium]|nr:hypothetical protein [Sphingomonas bacterium]
MDARKQAEARNAGGRYDKAPKRLVAQEVLANLSALTDAGASVVASLITSMTKSSFPDATPKAVLALDSMKSAIQNDRSEQEQRRKQERDDRANSIRSSERVRESQRAEVQAKRDGLRDRFSNLMMEANSQRRGYLLETFLNDLFDFEELDPRRSFKLLGEQIDGSFAWRSRTCLVEAKWVKDPVAGAEFGAFNYKIDGKSADTRGIYVSVNGYSPDAIRGMNAKGALKFVCIDGAHIMRALVSSEGISPILERVWRHADETGEAYLPVSQI